MNKLILIVALLTLGGCASLPKKVPLEKTIVTQTEFVIKIPPAALMTLPPAVPNINVDSAKQSDVAAWLLQKEQYTRTLENQIKDIATFFLGQQDQLNQAAKSANVQQTDAAAAADAQNAVDATKKKVDLSATPSK
jgi:ABC-type hemin transport system substrate-binding protein